MPRRIFWLRASPAPPAISTPLCCIWIGRSRSRRNGTPFSKRPGRWIRRVTGRRRARPGGRSWTLFRSTGRPRHGSDDWRGRPAPPPGLPQTRAGRGPPSAGRVRLRPRPPGLGCLKKTPPPLYQAPPKKPNSGGARPNPALGFRKPASAPAPPAPTPTLTFSGCAPNPSRTSGWPPPSPPRRLLDDEAALRPLLGG